MQTKHIRMLCRSCKGSSGGFGKRCPSCAGEGIRIVIEIDNSLSTTPKIRKI